MELSSHSFSGLSVAQLAEAALSHWAQLNAVLPALNEKQVASLLVWELSHRKNLAIVRRLHQRFSALRTAREREWLLTSLKNDTSLRAASEDWEVQDLLRYESILPP